MTFLKYFFVFVLSITVGATAAIELARLGWPVFLSMPMAAALSFLCVELLETNPKVL